MRKQIAKSACCAVLIIMSFSAALFAESVLKQLKQEIQANGVNDNQIKLEMIINSADDPEPFLFYGSELGKARQYDQAKMVLESGLKKFPGNISLLNNLGLVYLRLKRRSEAEKSWQAVLKIDPENEFATKWLESIALTRKEVSEISEKRDLALPDLEKQEKRAKQLFEQIADLDKWDVAETESIYQRVIAECPDTSLAELAYWKMSNLYLLGLDYPDYYRLVTLLEKFFEKYPDSYFSYDAGKRLISAYKQTGASQKAIDFINKNFDTAEDVDIRLELVSLYEEINDKAAAIKTLEEIIVAIPELEKQKRILLKAKLEILQNTRD